MKIMFILSFCFLQFSCVSLMVKKAGLTETKPILKKLSVSDKEVYFIGMRHVGKEEYYKNSKILIDSLYRLNYIVYVETAKLYKDGQPFIDTLAMKKMRKLKGLDFSNSYMNMNNSIVQGLIKKYELVGQPGYKDLGASDYKIVDINYVDLVQRFEARNGKVELDTCDLKTPLGQTYHCNRVSREKAGIFQKEFIETERDKFVAKTIKNSVDKKILVIFGLLHYDGIKKELKKFGD